MVGAGAVAVSDDGKPVVSSHLMRTALEYARTFDIPVADHCEEPSLSAGGVMHEGLVATRLGLKGIPAAAEEIMVARDILLAELTGGRVALCHLSTPGAGEVMRRAKERGLRGTAGGAPPHPRLTAGGRGSYHTHAQKSPPPPGAGGRRRRGARRHRGLVRRRRPLPLEEPQHAVRRAIAHGTRGADARGREDRARRPSRGRGVTARRHNLPSALNLDPYALHF